jgi:hypothetical protein
MIISNYILTIQSSNLEYSLGFIHLFLELTILFLNLNIQIDNFPFYLVLKLIMLIKKHILLYKYFFNYDNSFKHEILI